MIKLLVVDDNEQDRFLLQTLLTRHGYDVMLAADGAEALEKARDNPPDMVITDILMPGMDGYALCRQWKCDEKLKGIPLVFYTATYTDPEDEEFALRLGAERFIVKPQEQDVFLDTIEKVIEEYGAGRLPPSREPVLEEAVYFKEYNESLIRKLEDKLVKLELTKVTLCREISDRKQAEEEMRRLNRALRILSECSETLFRATDEAESLERVCNVIMEIGGYGLVWVGFAEDGETKPVCPAAWSAREPGYIECIKVAWDENVHGSGLAGRAIRTGKPVFIRDTRTDPSFEPWRDAAVGYGYLSVLSLPLKTPDCVFGALLIYAGQTDAFDEDEAKVLTEMAENLAYGVMALRTRAERTRAELDLLASEARYRRLFESAKDGILILDAGTGQIVDVNPFLISLLGFGRDEFLGKRLWEIGFFKDIVASEVAFLELQAKGYIRYEDLPLETKDGRQVDVEFVSNVYPVGSTTVIQCNIRDITKRKRGEHELRKLSMVVEQSPAAVVITDLKGNIEYVNPRFTENSGYTLEEVRGQNPRVLKSAETSPEEYKALWDTITSGGEWRGEFHNKKKDGTLFWERASISSVRDATGAITHFLGIKEDITQQKALEERYRQASKMEAIGQLAGGVAHDFNNIIQAVMGYSQMLLDALPECDRHHGFANQIFKSAERAATLTRQLLAFSRRQVLKMEDLNLNEVIENVTGMIQRIIGDNIQLHLVPGHGMHTVYADRGQLEQVLLNLCVNARDAMPTGGVLTIALENVVLDAAYCATHTWAALGRYVLLGVTDTGQGMDDVVQAHIFDPFFTTKEVGKGTGLGLATVYGIVEQHHGMVQVYSEVGKGTTLKVCLPIVERGAATVEVKVKARFKGGTECILVAEDDEALLKLTARILEDAGYSVLPAADGMEAIALFEKHRSDIDLFLLDVIMPNMSGKAVYDALRRRDPRLRFLFSSGHSNSALDTDFVLNEGVELIPKPYASDDLLRKVRQVLDAVPAEEAGVKESNG